VPDSCVDKIRLDPSARHGHECRRSLASREWVGRTELAGFVPRRCVVTDSRLEQDTWVRTDVRLGTDRVSGYLCHQLYIQVLKKIEKVIRKKKHSTHASKLWQTSRPAGERAHRASHERRPTRLSDTEGGGSLTSTDSMVT